MKNPPFRYIGSAAIAVGILSLGAGSAAAITAKDVLEKMAEDQRFGYVTGLVDMLSYEAVLAGNRIRAECISNEFYDKPKETWQLITATFEKFSDKSPEGLVVVLMNKACGG